MTHETGASEVDNVVLIQSAGVDLGNSATQVILSLDKNTGRANVPTICLPVSEWTPGDENKRDDESLYVQITSPALPQHPGKYWLVGKALLMMPSLADKGQRPPKGSEKVDQDPIFVTGLTTLALAAIRHLGLNSRSRQVTVEFAAIGVSLPYNQVSDEAKAKAKRKLVGTHELYFPALRNVGEIRVTLVIKAIAVAQEGVAALMAQTITINEHNQLTIGRRDLNEGYVGLVDVGGGTTNLILLGPNLTPLRDQCATWNYGVHDVLEAVHADLRADGYTIMFPTMHSVVERVRLGKWKQSVRGGELDLRTYIDRHMDLITVPVSSAIKEKWSNAIMAFYIVGGGAEFTKRVLAKMLPADSTPETPEAPEWQNAMGNWILVRRALREKVV